MEDIDDLRRKIDIIDKKIVILINERAMISKVIGTLKNKKKIAVIQKDREKIVYEKVENQSKIVSRTDISKIWKIIIEVCRKIQI